MLILTTIFLSNWQKLTHLAADAAHSRGYIFVLFLCGGVQRRLDSFPHHDDSTACLLWAARSLCVCPSLAGRLWSVRCQGLSHFLISYCGSSRLPPHTVCLEQQHVSGLRRHLDIYYSNKWYYFLFLYLYCCFHLGDIFALWHFHVRWHDSSWAGNLFGCCSRVMILASLIFFPLSSGREKLLNVWKVISCFSEHGS